MRTSRFFFTCLFNLWPMRVETRAFDGMERKSWRCFAPLLLHFMSAAGKGTFMRVPERSGLLEMMLTLSCSAVSKKERLLEYFYAKA